MNRPKFAVVVLASCLLFAACSGTQPPAVSGGASAGSPPASATPAAPEFNACSLFSVNDAQQITGAPMKVSPGSRAAKVCMYEEVTERPNSMGPGRISLTVNKRGSAAEEGRGWANLKNVRHLEAGQKNTSALSGIECLQPARRTARLPLGLSCSSRGTSKLHRLRWSRYFLATVA